MRVIPDGEALRRLREARGLSMEELAELAGVRKQTVWRIETGKVKRSYAHTMWRLAKALGCDRSALLRAVKQAAPPPEEVDPEEIDLSPEDFEELPDPAHAPPEPLLPHTMKYIAETYRAHEGKRFTYEAEVDSAHPISFQERIAIKCGPRHDGARFDTTLVIDGRGTSVPIYSNDAALTLALEEAVDHLWVMQVVVKVLVIESIAEFGTISDGMEVPPDALLKWKGFSWPAPAPKQMWCLVATEAARIRTDLDRTDPGHGRADQRF